MVWRVLYLGLAGSGAVPCDSELCLCPPQCRLIKATFIIQNRSHWLWIYKTSIKQTKVSIHARISKTVVLSITGLVLGPRAFAHAGQEFCGSAASRPLLLFTFYGVLDTVQSCVWSALRLHWTAPLSAPWPLCLLFCPRNGVIHGTWWIALFYFIKSVLNFII